MRLIKIQSIAHQGAALLFFALPFFAHAQTATINAGTVLQTMDGFGASTGYVEQNNNMTSAQATSYFSATSGIGLSWIRIQDCGSDTDCPDYGSTTYTPDLVTLQFATSHGAKALITFDFPTCDSGNYSSMAAYAVARIQYLQSQSVTVGAIGPENEPGNGNDCTAATYDTWVDYLGAQLAANSISIPIVAPESGGNYVYSSINNLINPAAYTACFSDSTCEGYVTYAGQHAYSTYLPPVSSLHYIPVPSVMGSRHNWQTEMDGNIGGSNSCTSNNLPGLDTSIADGIAWAQNIDDFLVNGTGSLWMYWNLQSGYEDSGSPNGCNDGLSDFNFNPAKRFYVLGNWSKFVPPGWKEIAATHNPQSGVYVTAFKNPSSGAFAIVAINSDGGPVSQTFDLSGLSAGSVTPYITDPSNNLASQSAISASSGSFTATLNASSVTTFVGTGILPGTPTNLNASVGQ